MKKKHFSNYLQEWRKYSNWTYYHGNKMIASLNEIMGQSSWVKTETRIKYIGELALPYAREVNHWSYKHI